MKRLASKHTDLKADLLQDLENIRLQACACIFQPGNFTGLDSEGVNTASIKIQLA